MSSCSTPHNSGNSERIVLPPRAASKSAVRPIAGFAEMPEKPSDPPHFSPTLNAESGAGERRLVEFGIALAKLLAKNSDLRMLAAQAQNCRSGHVRMVNITGDEPTKI